MALTLLNRSSILAKSASVAGMKFVDFMRFNEINLDEFTVDTFFHNIRRDMPIYMTESIIANMGYKGASRTQKLRLMDLLKSNFSEYENVLWWSYKNNKYKEFLTNQSDDTSIESDNIMNEYPCITSTEYPPVATGKGSGMVHHILVMPVVFKELLMLCQTEKGKQVRRYYLAMVDALEIYMAYQSMIVVKEKDNKIDELVILVKEERQKAEDRFNKLIGHTEDIQDSLDETRTEVVASSATINRMAENCVVPGSVNKKQLEIFALFRNNETLQFRVACVQSVSYGRTLADYKKECANSDATVCLKINYNANATMFWNSFCRKFRDEFMVNKNGRRFHIAPDKNLDDLKNAIIGHCDKQKIESME